VHFGELSLQIIRMPP